MKQHVNPKQLEEVSKEQISEWLSGTYSKRKNFYQYNCKKITVGKMIEILGEKLSNIENVGNLYTVTLECGYSSNHEKELVDALWQAVKYLLEEEKE